LEEYMMPALFQISKFL